MGTIYTIEGNTSAGTTLIANGGGVACKHYSTSYSRIAAIWRPKYNAGEAEKVITEAKKWEGYLEKKSKSQLDSKTANAGSGNYTIFAQHANQTTGSSVFTNGQAWCAMFVNDIMIRALGKDRTKQLLYDWTAYTPTMNNNLSKAGATRIRDLSQAKCGDIILFKNTQRICHVGYVTNGFGVEESITLPAGIFNEGSSGTNVANIQHALNVLASQGLTEDGKYGAKTTAAIQNMQRLFKIDITGQYNDAVHFCMAQLANQRGIKVN